MVLVSLIGDTQSRSSFSSLISPSEDRANPMRGSARIMRLFPGVSNKRSAVEGLRQPWNGVKSSPSPLKSFVSERTAPTLTKPKPSQ